MFFINDLPPIPFFHGILASATFAVSGKVRVDNHT
jgi:hypothetical protein